MDRSFILAKVSLGGEDTLRSVAKALVCIFVFISSHMLLIFYAFWFSESRIFSARSRLYLPACIHMSQMRQLQRYFSIFCVGATSGWEQDKSVPCLFAFERNLLEREKLRRIHTTSLTRENGFFVCNCAAHMRFYFTQFRPLLCILYI